MDIDMDLDNLLESEGLLEKRDVEMRVETSLLSRLKLLGSLQPSTYVRAGGCVKQGIRRSIAAVLPSLFFRVREERKRSLRQTAYLDGLRGFAALLVYALHHQAYSHSGNGDSFESITESSFGYNGNYHFSTLPGIRLFFSGGHFAVALFFVISGYALSTKPLQLLHNGEIDVFAKSVGSGLFRRWLRLYIPVFATTFIFMTSWHLFNVQASKFDYASPQETYSGELWMWYRSSADFSYLYSDTVRNPYNLQMWSIPVEFRGSIVVYSMLLASFQCKNHVRLLLYAVLVLYFVFIVKGCGIAFFIIGTFLSDIDMLAAKDQLPRILSWHFRRWVYYIPLILGLYLAGVPTKTNTSEKLREHPGWYVLSYFNPEISHDLKQFYFVWASALVMFAIPRIAWLKSFFETTFCQYIGRISFGLYLVHGPILFTIGARLYAVVGRHARAEEDTVAKWIDLLPVTDWGPLNLEVNNLLPHLILLPLSVWLGELVTRLIDDPTVGFLQWVFQKSTESQQSSEVKLF